MELDQRKQNILGAVVRDYVESARPVGSEELALRHAWGVKSATIRHELAELADLGYLRQPYTSAGRIPSDRGYRFYVDHLMIVREFSQTTVIGARDDLALDLENLLRQTCALLAQETSYTSVATTPRPADITIGQIFVSAVGDTRLLAVVLLSTGQVENRLLTHLPEYAAGDLERVSNLLTSAFGDQSLNTIAQSASPPACPPEITQQLRNLFDALTTAVKQVAQSVSNNDSVYLEGTQEILRQPEFRDVSKIEHIWQALHQGTQLFESLSRVLLGSEVAVVIGGEHDMPAMHECSLVSATYYAGSHHRGTIGVVGPTRMDYDRAVPAVSFFARSLSRTLAYLGGY